MKKDIECTYCDRSRQGYPIVSGASKDGRLNVVLKRQNDYVVAMGYNPKDGTWGQGRYGYRTLREAEQGLYDDLSGHGEWYKNNRR